ncbi:MAG: twin-arginine translocase TatA/TatE family subunit [Candidatus Glassbacteria bacterium]
MGFGNIGLTELIVILAVVLLLFGAKRIPEVMRSFGKGVSEFKRGIKELENDIQDSSDLSENKKSDKK